MDDATASTIIAIQLADLEEARRNGTIDPAALHAYCRELHSAQRVLSDRRMGRSIARAVITDERAVVGTQLQEREAAQDRRMACALGGAPNPIIVDASTLGPVMPGNQYALYGSMNRFDRADTGPLNEGLLGLIQPLSQPTEQAPTGPSNALKRKHENVIPTLPDRECAACTDKKPSSHVICAPCGDYYCHVCVTRIFQNAATDESLFPARCHRQLIPIDSVSHLLTPQLRILYSQKSIEYNTPNRTYCAQPTCSKFLRPDPNGDKFLTCLDCGNRTCSGCKTAAHEGGCQEAADLQLLLQMAGTERWQRCYNCKNMVELSHGCSHMRLVSSSLLRYNS
jgi:hypothetical protein